jgi:hypothetical protein
MPPAPKYSGAVSYYDDEPREAPPVVVGATAAGVAPLPFLAVYAVLFISHGSFHPVVPPDITTTKHGELVAGFIALGLFIVEALSVLWLMNARRRWLFVLTQAATLGTSIYLISDRTTGSPIIPILLVATSATALVLALLPQSGAYVRRPGRVRLFARSGT